MRRRAMTAFGVSCSATVMLIFATDSSALARKTGSQTFDGGLVVKSGPSGERVVIGSVIAGRGVFNGVGRIVERPNRPGDSDKVQRDDLVFPEGSMHLRSTITNLSVKANPRTCRVTFVVKQTAQIEGGAGKLARASGAFAGSVTATGLAARKANGTCDMNHAPVVEIDSITATGTLTL